MAGRIARRVGSWLEVTARRRSWTPHRRDPARSCTRAATEERAGVPKKDKGARALMQELCRSRSISMRRTMTSFRNRPRSHRRMGRLQTAKARSLEAAEKRARRRSIARSISLRAETVLLKPGESQCDVGIAYIFTDNDFPSCYRCSGSPGRCHRRAIPGPRADGADGIPRRPAQRVQGFISMPVGWANTQINVANDEDFRTTAASVTRFSA